MFCAIVVIRRGFACLLGLCVFRDLSDVNCCIFVQAWCCDLVRCCGVLRLQVIARFWHDVVYAFGF